jgi:nicotinate-nucleotide--dimethylbenzimidazole phosphoribosyltransferase
VSLDLPALPSLDAQAAAAAAAELDRKTKPRGSLGRLEPLAVQLAAVRGRPVPEPPRTVIVVVAADHGVTAEGVSAYPQEVTRQMLATFAAGNAAVCVLARAVAAQLVLVDAGTTEALAHPAIRDLRIGAGTANALRAPAMSRAQATEAVGRGIDLAEELVQEGATLLALGDMGIGNTTAAAAVAAALVGCGPAAVCGPGTGLDEAGVAHKTAVVTGMLERHRPDPADPLAVLATVGGFELGVLAGLAVGGAASRAVVLLDGFIVGAAALLAARLAPAAPSFFVAAHRSPEPGHRLVLDALGLEPLLDLGLRLGEGTGAALALPLVSAARALLAEMATFDEAGVTDAGR